MFDISSQSKQILSSKGRSKIIKIYAKTRYPNLALSELWFPLSQLAELSMNEFEKGNSKQVYFVLNYVLNFAIGHSLP